MPKKAKAKPAKRNWIYFHVHIALLGDGDIFTIIKLDADHFLDEWHGLKDKQWKELLLQDIESMLTEKLKMRPAQGEMVKAVSLLRRLERERRA